MSQFMGQAKVYVDSETLVVEDAELDVGGEDTETVYGDFKRQGYRVKPHAGNVKGTCQFHNKSDIIKIANARSVTVVFEADTGEIFTVSDAASVMPPKLKSNGRYDVEFEGNPAIQS